MTLRLEDISWDGLFHPSTATIDLSAFAGHHAGCNVLVTGAGGSIGSALSRAIHQLRPQTLVLLDSSEQNLYYIHRELVGASGSTTLNPIIGSVADEACVKDVFARFCPHAVYHAAALKHVPLGEMNPFAVVENNTFGTLRVAEAARDFGARCLIMISTDKSVNPCSIMGASKRLAEMIVLASASGSHTRMTSIRLGNVLGSEGSVVPLLLDQIARGGPVTVTDPEVERYFLTLAETVHRILTAVGDCPPTPCIAVPVLGNPVRIADLAYSLITQAFAPHVEVVFTGLRPGDKMREEFVAADETILLEANGLQWVQSPGFPLHLESDLAALQESVDHRDLTHLLEALTHLIPEYRPSDYLREQASTAAAK